VFAACFGLGRLGEVLEQPDVENVDVVGCDDVWVSYADGRIVRGPAVAASDQELVEMVRTFAAYHGTGAREFSTAQPLLNLRLPDGSRLTAWMAVSGRPGVSIRRHRMVDIGVDDLIRLGTLDEGLAAFLSAAVRARLNIAVTGRPNAGKTTLIRALVGAAEPSEKLVVIEKDYELALDQLGRHRQVVCLESREPNAEGIGEVTLTQLVVHALRMNPDRIIVGEVRSDELLAMLAAMHSGAKGSLTSLHANSARDAVARMTAIALSAERPITVEALHALVGGALDLVVHLELDEGVDGRRRYVAEVAEICGVGEGGRVATNLLYASGADGRATPTGTTPARLTQLVRAGFDRSWLGNTAWPERASTGRPLAVLPGSDS
jgi:Flp pilus assembly CpaF family ATPase